MISVSEYVSRNKARLKLLCGQAISSVFRVEPFDDDGRASCIGVGELILFQESGSLLLTVDEGYRNLLVFEAEGTRRFERKRAPVEDDGGLVSILVGSPIESISGLCRSRERAEESIFCGITIRTKRGEAHVGSYLTDIDDAGVCVLSTAQLDPAVSRYELEGGS